MKTLIKKKMSHSKDLYHFIAASKKRREKQNALFKKYMGEANNPFGNQTAKKEYEDYMNELRELFEKSQSQQGEQLSICE